MERQQCPCCGDATITSLGHYEICSVCGWEDDPLQSDDPNLKGGANVSSLNEYRQQWMRIQDMQQNREQVDS